MSARKPSTPSTSTSTTLLSAEDLFCIAHQGAPLGIRPDLIHADEDGEVVFTVRGIQFYRHAVGLYGIGTKLSAIQTASDVHRLHQALATSAFRRQVAGLDRHLVAALASAQAKAVVQAIVAGALDAITHAANQLRVAPTQAAHPDQPSQAEPA